MSYSLLPLPYWWDALEPMIDAHTVEIHYTKHHQTYCDKLNAGIVWTPYESFILEDLISQTNSLPDPLKLIVKNHGWWLLNHTIYWATMTPWWRAPSDTFIQIINDTFGSRKQFEDEFKIKAWLLFGSWWTWLQEKDGIVSIQNYPNQENPLMNDFHPIVGIDLWEHAYYLKHQQKRVEYIHNRWSLIDRSEVEKRVTL